MKRRGKGGSAFRTDVRGATLIEFAILAPIFIALLLAIFQVAMVLFAQQMMQTAAEDGGRLIAVGAPQKARQTEANYRTAVCGQLPGFIKCANLVIDVRSANTLADLKAATPAPGVDAAGQITPASVYAPGGPGTYNNIRLMYLWNVTAVPPTFNISDVGRGKKLMLATMIVKVEPYNP